MKERINNILREHINIVSSFFKKEKNNIEDTVYKISQKIKEGGKIIFMGNGGSASDSLHIATELIGKFYFERPPIASIALSSNPSILTEIGNDFSFDYVFSRQIEALAHPHDIIIGISTSGNSKNIIEGLKKAREIECLTIGFSGKTGGEMKNYSDICFCVPTEDTPRVQEVHIMLGHIICELLEKKLYGDENEL